MEESKIDNPIMAITTSIIKYAFFMNPSRPQQDHQTFVIEDQSLAHVYITVCAERNRKFCLQIGS